MPKAFENMFAGLIKILQAFSFFALMISYVVFGKEDPDELDGD
jgi:hypothetical protein